SIPDRRDAGKALHLRSRDRRQGRLSGVGAVVQEVVTARRDVRRMDAGGLHRATCVVGGCPRLLTLFVNADPRTVEAIRRYRPSLFVMSMLSPSITAGTVW